MDASGTNLLQIAVDLVVQQFAAEAKTFRDETTLFIRPDQVVDVARLLRDQFQFDMLVDLTAVDYWPQAEPRFYLNYLLCATGQSIYLRLRVPLAGSDPTIHTVEQVFPAANWYEREVWDLFGIKFEGHSDPRRIMMPEDWVGHPLRKDFPDGYEEVQFTFNVDEIQVHKLNPKE